MERYPIIHVVGEGSFGMVAKCRDVTTGRLVAIKKLFDSQRYPVTAVREVSVLHALKHDHVIPMIEAFRHCGYVYLVFQYMDYDLYKHLKLNNGVLTEYEAKRCTYQVRYYIQVYARFVVGPDGRGPQRNLDFNRGTRGLIKISQLEETSESESGKITAALNVMVPYQ